MLLLLFIFLFLVIAVLFIGTTMSYDQVAIFTLAIDVISLVRFMALYRKENIVCFELFFSVFFFLATYAYFFVGGQNLSYGVSIAEGLISYQITFVNGLLVSTVGYLSLLIGACYAHKAKLSRIPHVHVSSDNFERISLLIFLAVTAYFVVNGLSRYMVSKIGVSTGTKSGATGVLWWIPATLFYATVVFLNCRQKHYESFGEFVKDNKLFCILITIVLYIHFASSHRHWGLVVTFAVVCLYSLCVKRISRYIMVALFIGGYIMCSIIGFIRGGSSVGSYVLSVRGLMSDFLPASLATPFFIEYVEEHGITGGTNWFLLVIGIVPFLAGIVKSFGYESAPTSAIVFTKEVYEGEMPSGMGTSVVGDVYYTFGFVGVLICFFLLGYVVSWLYRRLYEQRSQSPYEIIVYVCMVASSFFMPRAEYLLYVSDASKICIVYFLCTFIFAKDKLYK